MRWKQAVLIVLAALLAGVLGLAASIAINGPGMLLRSDAGQALMAWWLSSKAPPGLQRVDTGEIVPAFELNALQGQLTRLPVQGRGMVINYWASWCGPCREEMPVLGRYAQSQGDKGIQVIGIALDHREDAEAFLREVPVPFPNLLEMPGPTDSSARMGNAQGVLPFSVLIGPDGRLLKRRFGSFASPEELQEWASGTP
ncbi:TlpA disulfide reductase family protein [Arenimonas sp.]|uniref:TlpA disulfide reductase family protein n=1 Tax=Arenimonas sp. TaxID=1872635 RepID=UPI0039E62287